MRKTITIIALLALAATSAQAGRRDSGEKSYIVGQVEEIITLLFGR